MKTFIQCPICEEILKEPVLLPCGHTICKIHEIDKEEKRLEKINCPTCNCEHDVSEKGFPLNLVVQNLIKFKLNEIDLGGEHTVAVESFRDLKGLVEEIKRMRENPELEIKRIMDCLRNKIDLRREKAKKSLDDEALALIAEIDQLELNCKISLDSKESLAVSTETEELIRSIENDDIPTWENDLKMLKRHVNTLKKIHTDAITKSKQLRKVKEELREQLFNTTDELAKLELKQKTFCQENTEPLA